jgi:hypothetical protein
MVEVRMEGSYFRYYRYKQKYYIALDLKVIPISKIHDVMMKYKLIDSFAKRSYRKVLSMFLGFNTRTLTKKLVDEYNAEVGSFEKGDTWFFVEEADVMRAIEYFESIVIFDEIASKKV